MAWKEVVTKLYNHIRNCEVNLILMVPALIF